MKNPFVSVIIPVRSINDYIIKENLPAHNKITYDNFEMLILPNEPSPQNVTLIKKYPWLKIIPTGKITRPAQKRNVGAKHAKGDILAFIDDDAYPSRNWLTHAVNYIDYGHFKDKIVAVCGPGMLPKNAQMWEKVFDQILQTWIGSGGFSYRFVPQAVRFVDDYPSMNFLVRKDVFEELKGFNGDYWPGEDSKLSEDIVYKLGAKILYHPSVVIYHHRRNSLGHFLKQHGNYGFHRGAFFAHGDKNSRRITYLIPTMFIVYIFIILTSLILNLKSPIFLFPFYLSFIIYSLAQFYLFITALKNTKSLKIALFSSIVLFLMHLIYGIRFVQGFFTGLIKKEKIYG